LLARAAREDGPKVLQRGFGMFAGFAQAGQLRTPT
jgi:hypothetical protein